MDKKGWKKLIKANCEEAGTYQPFFDSVIDTLAQILETRDLVHDEFVKGGSNPTVIRHPERSEKENIAKNPLLILEADLNTQALQYWKQLGLTPLGLRTLNAEVAKEDKIGLEKILEKLDG